MAGAVQRNEYYWVEGRVVRRISERPSGHGPWKLAGAKSLLIATIEETAYGHTVARGPAHSSEREIDALLLEHGATRNDAPIGARPDIPVHLLRELEVRVTKQTREITEKFRTLGGEERMTGALFDRLEGTINQDGWRVTISAHGYSNVDKEPVIGADAGVLIDILDRDGTRALKALWIQSKRASHLPADVNNLPRVLEQRRLMGGHTGEGYVVVYTPHGVFTYGTDPLRPFGMEELLTSAVRCERGDRTPAVIANTFDANHVLEILVGPR